MVIEISDFCPLLGFVYGKNQYKLLMMKCLACGKFVRKCWPSFYCPHCQISFIPNVSTESLKETEEIMRLCAQIDKMNPSYNWPKEFYRTISDEGKIR